MKTITILPKLKCTLVTLLFLTQVTLLYSQGAGTPDLSFAGKGSVITKIAKNNDDISQSVAVTPDNKIVVAGNSFNAFGYSNIGIVRYTKNGALDKTFNSTGKKVISNAFCNVVAVQPDKKIVICGSVAVGSNTVFGVWRLNSDGTNDNTFGTKGYQTVAFGGYVICFAMKLQSDGKILIAGNDGNFYAGNSSMILARLTSNGQLDNTFSGDGKFSLNLTKKSLTCNEILIQPDGNIIAAGQLDTVVRPSFLFEFFATRLHIDGTTDASFGNNGIIRAKNSVSDVPYCAGLLPNGKIVMGGYSKVTGLGNIPSVLCLSANGTIDKTFGTNGWKYPSFYGASGQMNSAVVQANGKIIFAGCVFNNLGISSAGIVRLNGDGSLDPSFAINGLDTFSRTGSAIVCNDAILQQDGKLLITGYMSPSPDYFFTMRFLNTQQLTPSVIEKPIVSSTVINNVVISPNPVTGNSLLLNLDLKTKSQISIAVYSLNGMEIIKSYSIKKEAGMNEERIQLPQSTSNGTYVCVISIHGESHNIKFIVQK